MAKSTKKRTVKCGKCGAEGHNVRSCTSGTKKKITSSADIPPPPVKKKTRVDLRDERRLSKVPRRDAPTAGRDTPAPYRCPKCNNVAILVAVKIKNHDESFKQKKEIFMSDLRCEKCMNKPSPSDLILKWGASPDEVVPIPGQDDA